MAVQSKGRGGPTARVPHSWHASTRCSTCVITGTASGRVQSWEAKQQQGGGGGGIDAACCMTPSAGASAATA